jgi:hypothetical protein
MSTYEGEHTIFGLLGQANKPHISLSYDLAVPFLGIDSKEMKADTHTKTYT